MLGEETAYLAGFSSSVGNWIAPNGDLIIGKGDTDHYKTLADYLGEPDTDNPLKWMNQRVEKDGFIRLVFRNEVWFQLTYSLCYKATGILCIFKFDESNLNIDWSTPRTTTPLS